MACSGCASNCMCLLTAGDGITVTGLGSALNPYVITATGGGTTAVPPQARYRYVADSGYQDVISGSTDPLLWDTPIYETSNMIDGTDPSVLLVPTGKRGWWTVSVHVTAFWDFTTTISSQVSVGLNLMEGGVATATLTSQSLFIPSATDAGVFNIDLSWHGILDEGQGVRAVLVNGMEDLITTTAAQASGGGTRIALHWDSPAIAFA